MALKELFAASLRLLAVPVALDLRGPSFAGDGRERDDYRCKHATSAERIQVAEE